MFWMGRDAVCPRPLTLVRMWAVGKVSVPETPGECLFCIGTLPSQSRKSPEQYHLRADVGIPNPSLSSGVAGIPPGLSPATGQQHSYAHLSRLTLRFESRHVSSLKLGDPHTCSCLASDFPVG